MGEVERFWIPMAQILPIFILGLVVEARLALPTNNQKRGKKRHKKRDIGLGLISEQVEVVLDHIARLTYAIGFAVAMFLLFTSFVLTIAVLAGGNAGSSSVSLVTVIAIVGAILTGLLPVSRLLEDILFEMVAQALSRLKSSMKARRQTAGLKLIRRLRD